MDWFSVSSYSKNVFLKWKREYHQEEHWIACTILTLTFTIPLIKWFMQIYYVFFKSNFHYYYQIWWSRKPNIPSLYEKCVATSELQIIQFLSEKMLNYKATNAISNTKRIKHIYFCNTNFYSFKYVDHILLKLNLRIRFNVIIVQLNPFNCCSLWYICQNKEFWWFHYNRQSQLLCRQTF